MKRVAPFKVLVFAEVNKQRLENYFPDIEFTYKGYSENFIVMEVDQIIKEVKGFQVIISEFETINQKVIDAADKLELLICCRGGISSVVDVNYAEKKGICVKNTPGRNAGAVAEYVIGWIVNLDRKFFEIHELIQRDILQTKKYIKPRGYGDSLWGMDEYAPYHIYRGKGLTNIVLGIIGYGSVGKVVSNLASLLGIKVIIHDHHANKIPAKYVSVDFETLIKNSDIISIHCSNKEHKVLFSRREFEMMKKGVSIINTARGDLIDEIALVDAVKKGIVKNAVLDVTKTEPLPAQSELLGIDNLYITPHIAGTTDEIIDNVTEMAIKYIKDYIQNNEK